MLSFRMKGSAAAARYDMSSAVDAVVPAQEKAIVPTDVAVAVPSGTYGRMAPRSGLEAKHHLVVGAGVIDADFRGNVKIFLFNHGNLDFHVSKGDRISHLQLWSLPNCQEPIAIPESLDLLGWPY